MDENSEFKNTNVLLTDLLDRNDTLSKKLLEFYRKNFDIDF